MAISIMTGMFHNAGIRFSDCSIVDDRMTKEESHRAVTDADVIWISGGDTPTQFKYLKEYGNVELLGDIFILDKHAVRQISS